MFFYYASPSIVLWNAAGIALDSMKANTYLNQLHIDLSKTSYLWMEILCSSTARFILYKVLG